MDLHEYLDLVTGQMRCKKAQDMVAEELKSHIEDQTAAYEESGVPKEEAEACAVAQMGDPVEVGTDMDRIHRPLVDKKMIGLVALLTLAGTLVQLFMFRSTWAGGSLTDADIFIGGFSQVFSIVGTSLLGFGLMLAVMFVDYSFLGKHPVAVWAGLLFLLILLQVLDVPFYQWRLNFVNISTLHVMLILGFSALVYGYRGKGYKGILLCLLWLFVGVFIMINRSNFTLSGVMSFFATAILVLSFAVQKGWYNVKKGRGQLLLWGVWGIPAIVLLFMLATGLIGQTYQTMRIQTFFHPSGDAKGYGFLVLSMREQLANLHFWKGSEVVNDVGSFYTLNYMMEKYGIFLAFVALSALALLFGKMFAGVSRQRNRLGSLVGTACVGMLLLTTALHVLVSLTLVPPTSAYLPFFDYNKNGAFGGYLLLGMYLSVYRNTMILSEKRTLPKKKLSIKIENTQ